MRPQTNQHVQTSLLGIAAAGGPRPVHLKSRAANVASVVETPGHVNLARWISPTDGDVLEFMRMYGHVGVKDMKRRCSERTYSVRKQTLLSTFRAVKERNRGIKTLAQFTPRLVPSILEYWSEDAGGKMRHGFQTQVQDYSVLTWFWRMHGISVQLLKGFIEDPQLKLKFARVSVATRDKSWSAWTVVMSLQKRSNTVTTVPSQPAQGGIEVEIASDSS